MKRIKLEYDEMSTSSSKEYIAMWDMMSNKDNRMNSSKCDTQMLLQSIRQGEHNPQNVDPKWTHS